MARKPPTAAEFASWLDPSDVLDFYLQQGDPAPKDRVIAMLCDGLLQAGAAQLILNGHDAGLALILPRLWGMAGKSDVWSTGRFRIAAINPNGKSLHVSAYDVRIDPQIREAVSPLVAPDPAPTVPTGTAKGGRPAGRHGEPIARVTKRLLAMLPTDISGYTVEAVAAELIEEYRRLGSQPPHLDNARRDASGILRVVRGET